MGKQLNSKILESLQKDDFEQVIHYIVKICEMIVNDFERGGRRLPNDENRIRSIMVEEYLDADEIRMEYGMGDYSFLSETQENYDGNGNYAGRADIRIQLNTGFVKHAAYYLVECKRIDGTSELNNMYIGEGVARFVTQKYSSYYGKNIMIGFVVKKIDISNNVRKIENIQCLHIDEQMHGDFQVLEKGKVCAIYKCKYQIVSGELELEHIFSDYSSIIERDVRA